MSDQYEEQILNFQAITGSYDIDTARELLQKNDWDVSQAASEFYAHQQQNEQYAGNSSPYSPQREEIPAIDQSSPLYNYPEQFNQVPEPQQSPSQAGFIGNFLNMAREVSSKVIGSFTRGQRQEPTPSISKNAQKFVQNMTARFPQVNFPNFETSSLLSTLEKANSFNMPVLIYLHTDEVPDNFIIEVLGGEVVRYMLDQFLIWGIDSKTNEGLRAAQLLNVQQVPSVSVVLANNPQSPQIIESCHGIPTLYELVEFLDRNLLQFQTLQSMSSQPTPAPVDPVLQQERRLRQQQEEEFLEVERQVRERQNQQERIRMEQLQQEAEKQRIEEQKETERQRKIENLKPEPEDGPDVCNLVFRMPNGDKKERRFLKYDTIQVMYDYIETLGLDFEYEIVTSFPTKILVDTNSTLEAEGLFPRALVHIRVKVAQSP